MLARAALLLRLAIIGLLPLVAAAQSACVLPPSGLIAWWQGEGNGSDSAGTNNAYALPNITFTE
jgi:ABC-type sugar transport system substrate-binding protein